MAKKDFSNIKADSIYNHVEEATAAEEPKHTERKDDYTEVETAFYMANGKTSGRKGLKLPRINMAFTPEAYEYVKTMSRASGKTMTDFVNTMIESNIKRNRKEYEEVKNRTLKIRF